MSLNGIRVTYLTLENDSSYVFAGCTRVDEQTIHVDFINGQENGAEHKIELADDETEFICVSLQDVKMIVFVTKTTCAKIEYGHIDFKSSWIKEKEYLLEAK